MTVYRGYSSHHFQATKQFRESDIELVKTDLINHIFTKRGDRVMMPTFGTLVPDLLFEPLDETTTDILEDELRSVFDYDPRVEILEFVMNVDTERSSVMVSVSLFYIELNLTDNLDLNIAFQ